MKIRQFPLPPTSLIELGEMRKRMAKLLDGGAGWDDILSEIAPYDAPDNVPAPWDPATLEDDMLEDWWRWADVVVAWINAQACWSAATFIPDCWPQHPHIVHEIGTLAWARYTVRTDDTAVRLSEWQKYDLPMFFDRLHRHLAHTSCLSSGHTKYPLALKMAAFSPNLPLTTSSWSA